VLTERSESPYKAFLFQGHVLDAKGRKMSKSLRNMLEANPLLDKTSADVFRFYVLWKCSAVDSMNFDLQELSKRPYQVLGTLYHLHKFFMQNAEYDSFDPKTHTLKWARENRVLRPVDLWLLSRLQGAVTKVTENLERCEFQFASSGLEDFVVDIVSCNYVPMVRKDLWTDDPETLNRRLAVYSTLYYTLKVLVLLFNPVTPFLCEALYQNVYRELDNELPESVNFNSWPTNQGEFENKALESQFEMLRKIVSLTYSARQVAKLKRRWPLGEVQVEASSTILQGLKSLEDLFLELANVKNIKYLYKRSDKEIGPSPEIQERDVKDNADSEGGMNEQKWRVVSEGGVKIWLATQRDKTLVGEGIMRDLARRVQSLRKELGFAPTDTLQTVHLAELDTETAKLLTPFLKKMAELVRAEKVQVHEKRAEVKAEWHGYAFDDSRIYIAITK